MQDLNTVKVGILSSNTNTSTSEQISSYINSIVSAETVALGGGIPDINYKAINCGIAIGLSAYANNNINNSGHGVAIGCETSAVNYGVAIGEKAKSDEALAIGPDAYAMHNALALGRYAKATGKYAVQLNGAENSDINNDDYTFKYYYGKTGSEKNITIVNKDGQISAHVAASCDGTANSANALNDGATITIGTTKYTLSVVEIEGTGKVLALTPKA